MQATTLPLSSAAKLRKQSSRFGKERASTLWFYNLAVLYALAREYRLRWNVMKMRNLPDLDLHIARARMIAGQGHTRRPRTLLGLLKFAHLQEHCVPVTSAPSTATVTAAWIGQCVATVVVNYVHFSVQ